jgi:hypothetical protein
MIISILGCEASNKLNYNLTETADIDGIWINTLAEEVQVVLAVEETTDQIKVTLLGEDIIPLDYRKKNNQAIIKFKNQKGTVYHLLAQLDDITNMRMSVTPEEIQGFVPVGQLGEKVYRLHKVNTNKSIMTSINKQ